MTAVPEQIDALVVGAGPAGLMAAETISAAGYSVLIAEAKPSPARKFLMAGKSGLNVTKNEPFPQFLTAYDPVPNALHHAVEAFGPRQVMDWSQSLGQEVFTGSSGRVFPKAMKASPLLRAWLARLAAQGAELRRHWRMTSLGDTVGFETPEGLKYITAKCVVLALGGASWARLGSNGAWVDLAAPYVEMAPFAPSNVGMMIHWTPHMVRYFGTPIKGVSMTSGDYATRGECVISAHGLEGGGIYALTRGLRGGGALVIDLLPDWSESRVKQTLIGRKPKESLTTFLKRAFRLAPEKIALMMEFSGSQPENLFAALKQLEIAGANLRPIDEAISTAGGVRFESLTDHLEARSRPGLFFAGEMLDWDAPTGGYLLTACLATGRLAGAGAIKILSSPQR